MYTVLLGNGDGTFRPAVSYAIFTESHPQAVISDDFNVKFNVVPAL